MFVFCSTMFTSVNIATGFSCLEKFCLYKRLVQAFFQLAARVFGASSPSRQAMPSPHRCGRVTAFHLMKASFKNSCAGKKQRTLKAAGSNPEDIYATHVVVNPRGRAFLREQDTESR